MQDHNSFLAENGERAIVGVTTAPANKTKTSWHHEKLQKCGSFGRDVDSLLRPFDQENTIGPLDRQIRFLLDLRQIFAPRLDLFVETDDLLLPYSVLTIFLTGSFLVVLSSLFLRSCNRQKCCSNSLPRSLSC